MRIRRYRQGDEDLITPNELMADWRSDEYDCISAIKYGETVTIVDDNGRIQAIVNWFLPDINEPKVYGWFLKDKDANPLFLICVKKIIKKVLQNNFIVYTMSEEGYMQDKMHEFLGFKKAEKKGGFQTWVVS